MATVRQSNTFRDGARMRISPSVFSGCKQALPVMLGYITVAFAFGILAVQAGFTPATAFLMSLLLYAGSGQFIGVSLVMAGLSSASIILTIFVVNLRHLLMSAALSPHLKGWSKPRQAWFAFELTDESFAVNLGRILEKGVDPTEIFTINTLCHWSWISGSVLGAVFGDVLGDVRPYGLDFALPGMFIALIIPHLRIPRRLIAVCLGAAASIIFAVSGAGQWSIVLATVLAATLSAWLPLSARKTPPNEGKEPGEPAEIPAKLSPIDPPSPTGPTGGRP